LPAKKAAAVSVAEYFVSRTVFHVRPRTFFRAGAGYPPIIEFRERDMTTIATKIFGTIIGGAIFFGVGIALAHAAVIG